MVWRVIQPLSITCNAGIFLRENRKIQQQMIHKSGTLFRSVLPTVSSSKGFHSSHPSNVNQKKKRVIVRHLNYVDHEKTLKHNYNPIVTLPDYTYIDGRPTEIMLSQQRREERNYQLAKQVVQLVGEMKFAQQQLQGQNKAAEDHSQQRQESQLKHKEHELT